MVQPTADTAINGLIPALTQCFGVIIMGYLAGRWNLLTDSQAQGLNSYVTKFALPAVFFKVMVSIDFSSVYWYFVAAVSLSKLIVFATAFCFTILLSRQCQLGMAAIISMFASQSNDVALAYPVLNSLYPDLASYVYMFAPTQLVLLNPIAYVLLEWHRLNSDSHLRLLTTRNLDPPSRFKRLMQAFLRVVLNPIFFMTVIGVAFNFILRHKIPVYFDGLLRIVAESFTATALFSLGFGMVGKVGSITQREVYILVGILMLKLVVCPFVTREICVQLMSNVSVNDSLRYSTFGFLYGAVPTAPPVYLFAAEYQILPGVIGVGLVFGTFLCAPIMFILAHIITLYMADSSQYEQLLSSTVKDVSWASIVGCIWTAIVLLVSRKAFRVPHRFTACHLVCVLLSCIGVVIGHFLYQSHDSHDHLINGPADWSHYVQFIIFFVGCTGTRVWTFLIALVMLLQRARGICFVLRSQGWIFLSGFALPILITAVLLLSTSRQTVKDVDPAFQYGRGQLISSLSVLLCSTIGTTICLIWYIRRGSSDSAAISAGYRSLLSSPTPGERRAPLDPAEPSRPLQLSSSTYAEESIVPDDADAPATPNHSRFPHRPTDCQCQGVESRRRCSRRLTQYDRLCTTLPGGPTLNTHLRESQHQRHLVLLFMLVTTMFFGICLCTWRLVQEAPSGVYLVLEFLDGTFNFGQGLALFIVFGLDADLIVLPVKRLFSRCLRRLSAALPSAMHTQPIPVLALDHSQFTQKSQQFVDYHLATCERAISIRINRNDRAVSVFSASSLKKWLVNSGLTRSADEATDYFEALRATCVIQPAPDDCDISLANEDLTSASLFMFTETYSDEHRLREL